MKSDSSFSDDASLIDQQHIIRSKHKFTPEEDKKLEHLVSKYGEYCWDEVAQHLEGRNPRQCKDRWTRYLSPSVNKSKWTVEEEKLLIKLVKDLNFKWVQIAKRFKGRTDNQIKNKWNILKKYVDIRKVPKKSPPKITITPQATPDPPVVEIQNEIKSPATDPPQQDPGETVFVNLMSHLDNSYFADMFAYDDAAEFPEVFGF